MVTKAQMGWKKVRVEFDRMGNLWVTPESWEWRKALTVELLRAMTKPERKRAWSAIRGGDALIYLQREDDIASALEYMGVTKRQREEMDSGWHVVKYADPEYIEHLAFFTWGVGR